MKTPLPLSANPLVLLTISLLFWFASVQAGIQTFIYDAAGRLVSADYGTNRAISYAYDNAGNLLRNLSTTGISIRASINPAGELILSWPVSADRFVLERAASLSALVTWNAVTVTPETQGDQRVVRIPAADGTAFYRLRKL
jgi:YD repeat-containing protein